MHTNLCLIIIVCLLQCSQSVQLESSLQGETEIILRYVIVIHNNNIIIITVTYYLHPSGVSKTRVQIWAEKGSGQMPPKYQPEADGYKLQSISMGMLIVH